MDNMFSNWTQPQDNVAYSKKGEAYAWEIRDLVLKIREYDKDTDPKYTTFMAENKDVLQWMFSQLDSKYIDIVDAVADLRYNTTVDNQYASYAEMHPNRLADESLERDYLNGPNCMMGNEIIDPAKELMMWEKNIRIKRFFRMSAYIKKAVTHNDRQLLFEKAGEFWAGALPKDSDGKIDNKKQMSFMRFDQRCAIVYLFNAAFRKLGINKAYKSKSIPWREVVDNILLDMGKHADDRLKADNTDVFVDGDAVEGGINPETQMILAEELI